MAKVRHLLFDCKGNKYGPVSSVCLTRRLYNSNQFSQQDRRFEAALSLFEAVLVKRWFRDTANLRVKQATWHDVYHSVRGKQFHRVKRILLNIYGKVS